MINSMNVQRCTSSGCSSTRNATENARWDTICARRRRSRVGGGALGSDRSSSDEGDKELGFGGNHPVVNTDQYNGYGARTKSRFNIGASGVDVILLLNENGSVRG
jgi:hypothetical protein